MNATTLLKTKIAGCLCLLLAGRTAFARGGAQSGAQGAAGARAGQGDTRAEFVVGNGAEPQSVDPTQIEGMPENRVFRALFETLVLNDPRTSMAVPGLAERWETSADGRVVTFHLRRGAVWSDGVPITAQTLRDSWLYMLNPATGSKYAYLPGMVIEGADKYNTQGGSPDDVKIRVVDDYTFEVTLVGSLPYAIEMMTGSSFSPLPMHAIEKYGRDWIKPEHFVGNGPFVLTEWIPNDHITVTPNERYWNKSNVFLSKITFLPIDDDNTAYQAYRNGEIDWNPNPPLARIDELKLRSDFQVAPQLGTYFYYFNLNHPVLKDVRVRQALAMGFDRQELIDKVIKGGQRPAYALVPPMGGYAPAEGVRFDAAGARRLLAEAGYPEGRGFPTLTVMYNTNEGHKIIAEYLQQAWKTTLGVDIKLENLEWATFLEDRKSSRMELGRAGWIGDYADPSNFLELMISTGGNNDGHYNEPEYDALLRRAAALPAGAERNRVMREAEALAITRDQAIIPIYYYVSQNLIDLGKWDGWYANIQDAHPYVGLRRK